MKAMSKKQLAQAAGVSRWTFRRWLNDPFMQAQLAQFNVKPKQRKLPGKLVKIICDHYVIDIS